MGRGYSFEAIRAKVLLTNGLRKTARPAYRKDWTTQADCPFPLAPSDVNSSSFILNCVPGAKQPWPPQSSLSSLVSPASHRSLNARKAMGLVLPPRRSLRTARAFFKSWRISSSLRSHIRERSRSVRERCAQWACPALTHPPPPWFCSKPTVERRSTAMPMESRERAHPGQTSAASDSL